MSSEVIEARLISAFLSLKEKEKCLLKSWMQKLFLTYLAALKSISITKSIDALLTFERARALTMHVLSFRLHCGSLP